MNVFESRAKERESSTRNVIRGIDPFLPPAVLNDSNLKLEALIRSRVLTVLLLSSVVVTAFTFTTLCIAAWLNTDNFTTPIVLSGVSFIVVSLNYLFFYKSGHLNASAILFSLTFFTLSVLSIILTGGYKSPVMPILACAPVVAFLVGGREEGVYNALLSYVFATTLLIMDAYDFPMMQLLTIDVATFVAGIIWFVTILIIVICLFVYDLLLEDMRGTVVTGRHTELTAE